MIAKNEFFRLRNVKKVFLKNKFNLLLPVFSNHLDTIDGTYSHSLEKIDFFVKNISELK